MTTSTTSLTYRKAALQHASTVGLVIALYDTLLGNLSRAAAAMERKDIQLRCEELLHGFKVLQQLELMIDVQKGGNTAIKVRRFYTHLRSQMLAAQFKLSPAILREQIKLLIDVREAWQQLDARGSQNFHGSQVFHSSESDAGLIHPQANSSESARIAFSCSG